MRKAFILVSILAVTPALADDVYEAPYPTDVSAPAPISVEERNRLNEYHQLLHNGLASQGGCNADELPVWIHERCNWRAFGRPLEGGGE